MVTFISWAINTSYWLSQIAPCIPSANIKQCWINFNVISLFILDTEVACTIHNKITMDYLIVLLNIIQCHLFYNSLQEVSGSLLTQSKTKIHHGTTHTCKMHQHRQMFPSWSPHPVILGVLSSLSHKFYSLLELLSKNADGVQVSKSMLLEWFEFNFCSLCNMQTHKEANVQGSTSNT